MRQGQHKNRSRNRSRRPSSPLSRVFESNGPDVKVRGTAQHVADKYLQLARDAQSSGDVIMAENYYQHAEHYLRILAAANSYAQQSGQQITQSQFHNRRPDADDEGYDDSDEPTAPGEDDQPVMMAPAGPAPVQGPREEQPRQSPPEDGEPADKTWGGPQPEFLRRGSNGASGRPRRPRTARGGQGQAEPASSSQPGSAESEQPVREVTD
jgi:hypothetical protein